MRAIRRLSTLSLGELGPASGATRQQNRVGRGPGSGRGKTAGRGQKGQKARQNVHPWFEGGQTPITKLFPKVGFKSKLPEPAVINLGTIQRLIDEKRLDPSKPITMRELYKSRAVNSQVSDGIKILARGASLLQQPIELSATSATQSAISHVEKLGGKFKAQYYTPFGMRALTRPEATLEKFARIPLRARPVDRRNIEFYRAEERRGYMIDAPGAPIVKPRYEKKNLQVSPLIALLKDLEIEDPSEHGAREGFQERS